MCAAWNADWRMAGVIAENSSHCLQRWRATARGTYLLGVSWGGSVCFGCEGEGKDRMPCVLLNCLHFNPLLQCPSLSLDINWLPPRLSDPPLFPHQHWADRQLWMAISRFLYAFWRFEFMLVEQSSMHLYIFAMFTNFRSTCHEAFTAHGSESGINWIE